ncbi:L,D-transpeptidase [Herpetosiphon llansteffanensis]|uniref:L,D-transpeptidase n=1 Tax=Herpetosiphon llansteffanensis TaxID=2094568 RepID=UPI000D7D1159|nr:L,D-transpeptidase [Herpetosiphon llansteffanensis]
MRLLIPRLLLLIMLLLIQRSAYAAEPSIQAVYFVQTGHHVDDQFGFLSYWRAHGQVTRLGYPITEQIVEHNRPVQYFERARLEFHAEQNQVLLGLLGRELGMATPAITVSADPSAIYIPETGHTLQGEFGEFWDRSAGIQILGYPIAEPTNEDGMLVQWFERGRLEYHPEALKPLWVAYEQLKAIDLDPLYEIISSSVGRHVAQLNGLALEPVPQRQTVPSWSPQLWPQTIKVSLTNYTLEAYEADLKVLTAPIAIGKPGFETVSGSFLVYQKWWEKDMQSSERGESWNTSAVPFVQFFYRDWAIHGTYWHADFGTRRSHGCINLALAEAEWLYNWTDGAGTAVIVQP